MTNQRGHSISCPHIGVGNMPCDNEANQQGGDAYEPEEECQ